MSILIIVVIVSVIALVFTLYKTSFVGKQDEDSDRMREIAGYVHDGVMAFLKRGCRSLIIFVIALFVILGIGTSFKTTICFLVGALFSVCAGYIGMSAAAKTNVRIANAAHQHGMRKALDIAFSGGAVIGLYVVEPEIIGISILYYISQDVSIITGFSLEASPVALFARVGGGIYTRVADVGADPIGKVRVGIPEDDPRNPAVIADNVRDNVGGVTGMGADLFESYVGALLSVTTLGVVSHAEAGVSCGITIAAVGILASVVSVFSVRGDRNPQKALNMGTYIASIITIIASVILANHSFGNLKFFIPVIVEVCVSLVISKITECYTSDQYGPVHRIAEESATGDSTNIIAGLSIGMMSTIGLIIALAIGIILAYNLSDGSIEAIGGFYGVALVAMRMLATTASTIAIDAYGPVADNAGGIAEMYELPEGVREVTDSLDSIGNTTTAIGKGFIIGSATLTALSLFVSYIQTTGLTRIDIPKPAITVGTFIGGMLLFAFSALTMSTVGNAVGAAVGEVRHQFKKTPDIMEGKAEPEHTKCVDISIGTVLKEMIVPGMIAAVVPILVDVLIGTEALGDLQAGALVTGVLVAIFMSNAGRTWDNAKKYIEGGAHGEKGTVARKAAVTDDTVGDPFKDTSGPSLNILIKLITVVSLVSAPLFVSFGGILLQERPRDYKVN